MKILVVLPRFPYPLEKGDKLRAFHQIRMLSKNNEIYLFCLTHTRVLDEHVEAVKPFCKDICIVQSPKLVNYKNIIRNYFLTKSLQLGYWDSLKVRKAFKSYQKKVNPDVIYSQMIRTMPWVSRSLCPKVMDFQDALSMNAERRMDQAHGIWHFILHYEFKMLRSTEYNSFKIFDALTIISEPDCDAIPHKRNGDIHVVPNGVDFDFFAPIEQPRQYDIVFCGNMRYEPNVRAAQFLAEKIMPLVWQTHPNASLLLAGACPKAKVSKLASDHITVIDSPEDIRKCYASARIFAAPMLTGSGLQNKLLEAMAMQMPCVTTSIANDSLHAEKGREVLVGDTAREFADHIVRLLDDEDLCHSIARNGNTFVHNTYSWELSCSKLESILQSVCGKESLVLKEHSSKKEY